MTVQLGLIPPYADEITKETIATFHAIERRCVCWAVLRERHSRRALMWVERVA